MADSDSASGRRSVGRMGPFGSLSLDIYKEVPDRGLVLLGKLYSVYCQRFVLIGIADQWFRIELKKKRDPP